MVRLNRIYTRGGDKGRTALGSGKRVAKDCLRIEAIGAVDEANAAIGLARLSLMPPLDAMLGRIQNDLFDLGADLCLPEEGKDRPRPPLRMSDSQVERLEQEMDALNAELAPLTSFVMPGGAPAAAALHMARAVTRRAERHMVSLARVETLGDPALRYINRLSDFLFVAARFANKAEGRGDVLWVPGENR